MHISRKLRAIESMYTNTRAKVISPDGQTEMFDITAGVLQGDTLAPFLFVVVFDYALRKALTGREEDLGFTITPRKTSRHPQKSTSRSRLCRQHCSVIRSNWRRPRTTTKCGSRVQESWAGSEWAKEKVP